MGKPCIVGCSGMTIDVDADRAQLAGATVSGSDWITIDGDSGNIYFGRCETVVTRPEAELAEIASWRSQAQNKQHETSKSIHNQSVRVRTERKKQSNQ
jgi:pyruvate,orthophosphate dikinase